ncbi:MAG: hypothetical protein ACFCVG_18820 [Kineosporiaceae bacterium]
MRALAVWLPALALVLGGYAVLTDRALSDDPQQVLVVVDSSFDMEPYWRDAGSELADLDGERYTEYALATEKDSVHGFQGELGDLDDVTPFAPCDAADALALPEAGTADRVVLVTTAGSCLDSEAPGSWDRVTVGG